MSMPGGAFFGDGVAYWGANLTLAVLNGSVPTWRLDDMATRIMSAYFFVGQDDGYPATNMYSWSTDTLGFAHPLSQQRYGVVNGQVDVRAGHAKLIRDVGARSVVLLKNAGGVLPLTGRERQIAVFGSDAHDSPLGPNDRGGLSGTLAVGWGSGIASFPYLVSPLEAVKARARRHGAVVQSVTDDYAYAAINATASQASVCLAFVNSDSGEIYIQVDGNLGDRKNLTAWHDGNTLVGTVAAHCRNTVVVIHAVGPVLVDAFVGHPNVTAVLFAGLPGQESGDSLVDVLYGDVNPSGRLPFTIAKRHADYGVRLHNRTDVPVPQEAFSEGLLIDYRHFDKAAIAPRFEFGFGLSYTTFAYSNLSITALHDPELGHMPSSPAAAAADAAAAAAAADDAGGRDVDAEDYLPPAGFDDWKIHNMNYPYLSASTEVEQGRCSGPPGACDGRRQPIPVAGGAPGGNPRLYQDMYEVSATVANTGGRAGEEVVQLYLSTGLEDDPVAVLRAFEKVAIPAGQSRTVTLRLTRKDLSRWDAVRQDWAVAPGRKDVLVGSSSRRVHLRGSL